MMRSMFAAISGLKQHQTMLDVTANDIANVNTLGFKANRVTFKDSLSQLQRGGAAQTPGQGGQNPAQVGLGVGLSSIDTVLGGGALQTPAWGAGRGGRGAAPAAGPSRGGAGSASVGAPPRPYRPTSSTRERATS